MIKRTLAMVAIVGFVGAAMALAGEENQGAAKCAGACCPKDTSMHVVAIKDGQASCCACKAACKCTMKADDPAKCSCGKDLKKCDLKGKFVCTKCNVIADQAGKCAKCNGDLTEVK
jgi:hypothetical protein